MTSAEWAGLRASGGPLQDTTVELLLAATSRVPSLIPGLTDEVDDHAADGEVA